MKKRLFQQLPKFRGEYFLFLLPLFFVVHGYNEYYGKITVEDAFWLWLEFELVTGALAALFYLALFYLVLRPFRKAALFAAALMGYYFFFGAAHDWLKATVPGTILVKYSVILPLTLLFFTALFFCLKKTEHSFRALVKYLNLVFACLLAVEAARVPFKKVPHQDIVRRATTDSRVAPLLRPCDTCAQEDIHLIVLDEYAGAEQLKDVFGFNNRPFADTLRARGFLVLEGARSNYNYSPISMASLFSLDYLPGLGPWPHYVLDDIANPIMEQNTFIGFLQRQGYTIHNISIFDLPGAPAYKHYFKPGARLIKDHTFLNRLVQDLGYHLLTTLEWDWAIRSVVQDLEAEAALNTQRMQAVVERVRDTGRSGPQFYYTHLMMPHAPYVLDRHGRSAGFSYYLDPDRDRGLRRGYLEYLLYANKKVVSFIDTILKTSSRPPVVILMGDHGFRHREVEPRYHFMTLNAVYFPDRRYDGFYDGLTHVNQLRLLLNNRLRQNLPLLKDSTAFLGWPGMEATK
jgi:hypothetical protein